MFDEMEAASAAKDINLIFLPVDPKWDAYRNDACFQSLFARCGFTKQ